MSAQHTPGPWEAEYGADGYYYITHSDGLELREVAGGGNGRVLGASVTLLDAAIDALAGWRYIRKQHGDLYGVGWDRVEAALTAAVAKAIGGEE